MRVVLAVATLAGCAYHPGSFTPPGGQLKAPGRQMTIGCIDLAIDRRADFEESAVLEYSFGNRCNQPATLDFTSLAVWATTESGEQRLYPYDPRSEISQLPIEGRLYGHEVISYPLPQPATRICVDAASIAHVEPPQWQCFESKQAPVIAQGEP
jgi:hypothetical protein